MIERKELGYLMIDHRHADPLPEDQTRQMGLPPGAGSGLFEASTFTCTHCGGVVILNPLRTRERTKCRGCNHLICDNCAAVYAQTHACKTLTQVIDEYMEQQAHQPSNGGIILSKG